MTAFAGKAVTLRCPKCRSGDFLLIEVVEVNVEYGVKGGLLVDVVDRQDVAVIGLAAECQPCGHKWRPRGRSLLAVVEDTE